MQGKYINQSEKRKQNMSSRLGEILEDQKLMTKIKKRLPHLFLQEQLTLFNNSKAYSK